MSDTSPTASDRLTMYGADWCSDCRRAKAVLERTGVDYDYVDIERETDGADRAQALSGRMNIPVIAFPDGAVQVEPGDAELEGKLRELSLV